MKRLIVGLMVWLLLFLGVLAGFKIGQKRGRLEIERELEQAWIKYYNVGENGSYWQNRCLKLEEEI